MERIFKAGKYELPLGQKNYVMGILSMVPGQKDTEEPCLTTEAAVAKAWDMAAVGADAIDVNGQSENDERHLVSAEEELKRVLPVLQALQEDEFSVPVSVETRYASVAYACVQHGADIINDLGGFKDPAMIESVAVSPTCGCIVKHRGSGEGKDILEEIRNFFAHQVQTLNASGIDATRICLAPGIGHGKTYEENLRILANTDKLRTDGCCLLMTASHKRVINAASGCSALDEQTTPGTIAADSIAQFFGIDIVRAHDVADAVQASHVTQTIRQHRQ